MEKEQDNGDFVDLVGSNHNAEDGKQSVANDLLGKPRPHCRPDGQDSFSWPIGINITEKGEIVTGPVDTDHDGIYDEYD